MAETLSAAAVASGPSFRYGTAVKSDFPRLRRELAHQAALLHRVTVVGAIVGCVSVVGCSFVNEPEPGEHSHICEPNDSYWDARYDEALPPIDVDTRWVAVDGNDEAPCTSEDPCATIARALEEISPGGQVVVRNGHYVNRRDMVIRDGYHRDHDHIHIVPSGLGRDRRTVIRAETRFGVRISFEDVSMGDYEHWLGLDAAKYVWVDGFVVEWLKTGQNTEYMVVLGAENVLTRCIFRRDEVGKHGGMVWMGGLDSHSLIQDVHGVGGATNMVSTGWGGKNIVRRSVFRLDFSNGDSEIATFSHYGSNSQGTLFQNTIAIDGPDIDTGSNDSSHKWGSYYNPGEAIDLRYQGAMSISDGGDYGFYVGGEVGSPHSKIDHSAVIGGNERPRGGIRTTVGTSVVSNITIANIEDQCTSGNVEQSHLLCSPREIPEDALGRADGADLTTAFGKFLSVWGECGYDRRDDDSRGCDELTSDPKPVPLWPFPYENEIKAIFAEQLDSPAGYTPTKNVSARGFASGTSLDGGPQTLCKYIWELGETPIPDDIHP